MIDCLAFVRANDYLRLWNDIFERRDIIVYWQFLMPKMKAGA